jgi:hypothetical protein
MAYAFVHVLKLLFVHGVSPHCRLMDFDLPWPPITSTIFVEADRFLGSLSAQTWNLVSFLLLSCFLFFVLFFFLFFCFFCFLFVFCFFFVCFLFFVYFLSRLLPTTHLVRFMCNGTRWPVGFRQLVPPCSASQTGTGAFSFKRKPR